MIVSFFDVYCPQVTLTPIHVNKYVSASGDFSSEQSMLNFLKISKTVLKCSVGFEINMREVPEAIAMNLHVLAT